MAVARQRLGRVRQSRSVWTLGCCWRQATCQYPPPLPPPPRHCPANPPDINTADTPITDGSPAPGSQWPVAPQPPRQCANMRGRSSGRGSYKGRGSSQTLAGRVETQTRGHGAVTRSRYTGCHRGRHRLLSHLKSGEVHVSVKMRRVVFCKEITMLCNM